MATRDEWMGALRRAHEAGDVDAANEIARRVRALDAATTSASSTVGGAPDTSRQAAMPGVVAGASSDVQTSPAAPRPSGPPYDISPKLDIQGNIADKAIAGFGSAATSLGQNVKQAFPKTISAIGDVANTVLPDEVTRRFRGFAEPTTDADIEANRAVASTGPGMAGNVAGNVAMTALPVAKGVQLLSGAGKALPTALQGLAAASAVPAVSAAESFLTTPVKEDESRAKNAAIAAAIPAGLQVGGRILTQAVKPTKEALELLAKNIVPTVGQGGSGIVARLANEFEKVGEQVPLVGRLVRSARGRAGREAVEEVTSRASPVGEAGIAAARREYFKELDDQLLQREIEIVAMPAKTYAEQSAKREARAALNEQKAHRDLLEKAAGYSTQGEKGEVSFKNLVKAVEETTPGKVLVRGVGRAQDITEPGKQVMRDEMSKNAWEALARRVGYGAAGWATGGMTFVKPWVPAAIILSNLASTSRSGAKALMGQFGIQKKMADLLKKYEEELGTGAATIAGTEKQRD